MDTSMGMKSRGLKFAEEQMLRHGWTEGKGLGKHEDGISKAIKVKVKCDTAGVGHNTAEQFTFHWWDHVFNKTASSISVEPDQDGVKVKKVSEEDAVVSSKKPRAAMLYGDKLYGRFIKAATLTSGGLEPVEKSSPSITSDSSEDEDSKLDLSSATKLSDEDLVKICGGRTAHKGARHGLTMNAKLSRIEEQERAFMEKYGKEKTKPQSSNSSSTEVNGEVGNFSKKKKQREEPNDNFNSEVTKKSKKKHKKGKCEDESNGHDQEHIPSTEEVMVVETLEEDEETTQPTKKKKKRKTTNDGGSNQEKEDKEQENIEEETEKSKKKKKKRETVDNEESMMVNGHTEDGDPIREEEDEEHGNSVEKSKSKKKKKKRIKDDPEELVKEEQHTECSEEERSRKPKSKRKGNEEHEEHLLESEEEGRSRTKKKKLREKESDLMEEEDTKVHKKRKKQKHREESA
ncbi:hypothetical protein GDO81_014795 [Engystomops pustulosus]|uniref:G patch domain-containing protein 4 n=1 Tax=Engystomops pustulosus TaxID=76066 RepID=A0AAV7AFC8_ENGPU|nr:hypothetical protein GDO81_014795 [Engystomops pustulosus]KAG8560113.1 hypothetical protein GDO81_014795 [Engystomops pustulosus]KAG8560114.1 hypothetical protein GDO81_014795 [Engystomops pustulosus]